MWIKQETQELQETLAGSTIQMKDVETLNIDNTFGFWVGRECFISKDDKAKSEIVAETDFKLMLVGANRSLVGNFATLAEAKNKAIEVMLSIQKQLEKFTQEQKNTD